MMSKPEINVTPLIDVLLVLLIIFMVVTPLKPSAFEARVPQEPAQKPEKPHPLTLIVSVDSDGTALFLNGQDARATIADPSALIKTLSEEFEARRREQVFADSSVGNPQRIEKTVFIKAPHSLNYGSVAKVVDAVKLAGADPISLQVDMLD